MARKNDATLQATYIHTWILFPLYHYYNPWPGKKLLIL
jgi:hypothetical protein